MSLDSARTDEIWSVNAFTCASAPTICDQLIDFFPDDAALPFERGATTLELADLAVPDAHDVGVVWASLEIIWHRERSLVIKFSQQTCLGRAKDHVLL